MKIYGLNIRQGGGIRADEIINQSLTNNPDVIVFTEYRNNQNAERIQARLSANGYRFHALSSLDRRQNCVGIFSKAPFVSTVFPRELGEQKHRAILASFDDFSLLAVYFPQRQEKKLLFDFIKSSYPNLLGAEGIILGDFNTGNNDKDSQGAVFHCARDFDELCDGHLVDSWRKRNDSKEFTWYSNTGNGFRIDHALTTPLFDDRIKNVYYSHKERDGGASDHSAIVLEFS